MHPTRLSIIAALAALLLAGCGKDAAPGTTGATGEDGLPKPDAVSGSVTGMPNPGESTPNPGQPVDVPPDDILETPADIVPIEGEIPPDIQHIPEGGSPEMPASPTTPAPAQDPATPANASDPTTAGAGQP